MAGGAGTYLINGVAYSTVASAITQLIADEDGASTTAAQILDMSIDSDEATITLPSITQVASSAEYPVRLQSNDGTDTLENTSGNLFSLGLPQCWMEIKDLTLDAAASSHIVNIGAVNTDSCYLHFKGCTVDNSGGTLVYGRYNCNFYVEDCTLNVAQLRMGTSTWYGDIIIKNTAATCAAGICGNDSGYAGSTIYAENSRFRLGNNLVKSLDLINVTLNHCTIQFTAGYYITWALTARMSDGGGHPNLRNCIIDGAKGISRWDDITADSRVFGYDLNSSGQNIWSNLTGANFFDQTDCADPLNYTTLANYQSGTGSETGSVEEDVTFSSTVWNNANFLKLSADTTALMKNSGLAADAFGTARESYSNITPGAHQYSAATEAAGGGGGSQGASCGFFN